MTDSKKLLKQPKIEQVLLKKELNLPSKAVRLATHKEQALIQSFGNNSIEYHKYLEENTPAAPVPKRRSWIRFKSDSESKPELDVDTDAKPDEPPITKIIKELTPKILIGIVDSKLPKEQKEELKVLFEELRTELQKSPIEWQLIIPTLKKTIDYDLKAAALIVHLTSACHQLWEHDNESQNK